MEAFFLLPCTQALSYEKENQYEASIVHAIVTQIYRYMYNYTTSEPPLCFCNFVLQESRPCEPIMEPKFNSFCSYYIGCFITDKEPPPYLGYKIGKYLPVQS